MRDSPAGWALLIAVLLFVAFLALKSRIAVSRGTPEQADARRRIGEAKRRARETSDGKARAAAWREAAAIALDGLQRPSLAASYARRAERADPDDVGAVEILTVALRRASRYRALERFLWRRLAGAPGASHDRAFESLCELYDGPLRRPVWTQALRSLRRAGTRTAL
jgi:hypothetical protein